MGYAASIIFTEEQSTQTGTDEEPNLALLFQENCSFACRNT